jgi:hypothetical protein
MANKEAFGKTASRNSPLELLNSCSCSRLGHGPLKAAPATLRVARCPHCYAKRCRLGMRAGRCTGSSPVRAAIVQDVADKHHQGHQLGFEPSATRKLS